MRRIYTIKDQLFLNNVAFALIGRKKTPMGGLSV